MKKINKKEVDKNCEFTVSDVKVKRKIKLKSDVRPAKVHNTDCRCLESYINPRHCNFMNTMSYIIKYYVVLVWMKGVEYLKSPVLILKLDQMQIFIR